MEQSAFTGWAIVELMGHQKEIGFVTTEAYGQAVLFRVDQPELPEREIVLRDPEYIRGEWCPAGTLVKRSALEARSRLLSPGALYAINPCTETAARAALEKTPRPLIRVQMPDTKPPLLEGFEPDEPDGEDDPAEEFDNLDTGEHAG